MTCLPYFTTIVVRFRKIREKIRTVCSNHYYLVSRWAHFESVFYLLLVSVTRYASFPVF